MAAVRETVTVVRKPRADRLKPTSATAEEIEIPRCIVIPRTALEDGQGWVQISGFTLYAPAGTVISPDDQVLVRGNLYQVAGEPSVYPVKRGLGVAVTLSRVGRPAVTDG